MSRSIPSLKVRVRGLEIEIRRRDGDVIHLCIHAYRPRDIADEEWLTEGIDIHTVHNVPDRQICHGADIHLFERLELDSAQHDDDVPLLGHLIFVWHTSISSLNRSSP